MIRFIGVVHISDPSQMQNAASPWAYATGFVLTVTLMAFVRQRSIKRRESLHGNALGVGLLISDESFGFTAGEISVGLAVWCWALLRLCASGVVMLNWHWYVCWHKRGHCVLTFAYLDCMVLQASYVVVLEHCLAALASGHVFNIALHSMCVKRFI